MSDALRARIQIEWSLTNEARGALGVTGKLYLMKAPGETYGHVAMKLLSYFVFYHPDLVVEADADQHFKPDLVRFDPAGRPLQWVDCGKTALAKLDTISAKNRLTHIDIVKKTRRELEAYRDAADKRVRHSDRVCYLAFDDHFVDRLGEHLSARVTLEVTVVDDHLYATVDGTPLDTALHRL